MEPFRIHTGLVAPMDRENVDTDAIIPKQFLKSIKRTGFGPNLFDEWRYLDPRRAGAGSGDAPAEPRLRPQPAALSAARRSCWRARTSAAARRASTRRGRCSSTAFAPLIAPSYADIFFNNCFKNGLLPIVLPEHQVAKLFDEVAALRRLSADDRPRAPGRDHRPTAASIALRGRAVSQVLPARRLRRHRADAAPRRQDPRLRGRAAAEAAVARDDDPLMARRSAAPDARR